MYVFNKIENNLCVDSIMVSEDDCNGNQQTGNTFIQSLGLHGEWIIDTCSKIGYTYNQLLNKFVSPQPYPSWGLDENGVWQAPDTGQLRIQGISYAWDEDTRTWFETT